MRVYNELTLNKALSSKYGNLHAPGRCFCDLHFAHCALFRTIQIYFIVRVLHLKREGSHANSFIAVASRPSSVLFVLQHILPITNTALTALTYPLISMDSFAEISDLLEAQGIVYCSPSHPTSSLEANGGQPLTNSEHYNWGNTEAFCIIA